MRWAPFIIAAYLVVVLQTTVAGLVQIREVWGLSFEPGLPALLAVYVACSVRSGAEAMLAAWVLGLGVGLTTAGGPGGSTALGPMAVAYALAAGGVYRVRGAFFVERPLTQMVLAAGFCVIAHGTFVTVQSLLAYGDMTWGYFGRLLLQAAGRSAYTAAVAPLAFGLLRRVRGALLAAPLRHQRR
jgi:rod shape-determining protein MreD